MSVKSKFHISVYFVLIVNVFFISIFIFLLLATTNSLNQLYELIVLLLMLLFSSTMVFSIFFLEGILKINSIKINNHEILVKKGWGCSKKKKYRLKDIEGFYSYTRKVRRKKGFVYTIDEYKYLLLVQNGKIVARISEQYHKNYKEIANFTQKHLSHLGHKKPGLLSEIKDAVKF